MLKRAFDLVAASLGLVTLLPVLSAVAVAVRLSSPGPVFFRQIRVGFGGRDFVLLKFRTMTVRAGSEKGAFDAGDGSPACGKTTGPRSHPRVRFMEKDNDRERG